MIKLAIFSLNGTADTAAIDIINGGLEALIRYIATAKTQVVIGPSVIICNYRRTNY